MLILGGFIVFLDLRVLERNLTVTVVAQHPHRYCSPNLPRLSLRRAAQCLLDQCLLDRYLRALR